MTCKSKIVYYLITESIFNLFLIKINSTFFYKFYRNTINGISTDFHNSNNYSALYDLAGFGVHIAEADLKTIIDASSNEKRSKHKEAVSYFYNFISSGINVRMSEGDWYLTVDSGFLLDVASNFKCD